MPLMISNSWHGGVKSITLLYVIGYDTTSFTNFCVDDSAGAPIYIGLALA
jgi:hypothetical protein